MWCTNDKCQRLVCFPPSSTWFVGLFIKLVENIAECGTSNRGITMCCETQAVNQLVVAGHWSKLDHATLNLLCNTVLLLLCCAT